MVQRRVFFHPQRRPGISIHAAQLEFHSPAPSNHYLRPPVLRPTRNQLTPRNGWYKKSFSTVQRTLPLRLWCGLKIWTIWQSIHPSLPHRPSPARRNRQCTFVLDASLLVHFTSACLFNPFFTLNQSIFIASMPFVTTTFDTFSCSVHLAAVC